MPAVGSVTGPPGCYRPCRLRARGFACPVAASATNKATTETAARLPEQSFLGATVGRALEVFVRSRLTGCDGISVKLACSNRELLAGSIGGVHIAARNIIYKGLAVATTEASAAAIKLDMSAMLSGGRILKEPFLMKACFVLEEKDLSRSLTSPLLANLMVDVMGPRTASTAEHVDAVPRPVSRPVFSPSAVDVNNPYQKKEADDPGCPPRMALLTGAGAAVAGGRLHFWRPATSDERTMEPLRVSIGLALANDGLGLSLDCREDTTAIPAALPASTTRARVLWSRIYTLMGGTQLTSLHVGDGALSWGGDFKVTP